MSSEGLGGIIGLANFNPERGGVNVAQYGTDKGLIAEFYMEPVEVFFDGMNDDGTARPVSRKTFRDVAFVHIFAPGNKSDIRRQVKLQDDERGPSDPNRFPRQWAAFQSQNTQTHDGMPLEHWPVLSKSEVLEWKACKVYTVEQLSNMPDTAANAMPLNWRSVRDKARSWLKAASGDHGAVVSLQSEVDILKAENKRMQDAIEALGIAKPEAPAKRKYTRKSKPEGMTANVD